MLVIIISVLIGVFIGIELYSIRSDSKTEGNLVVMHDQEDGTSYMFLELNEQDYNKLNSKKKVTLDVVSRTRP